jgi:hypothetical protein
MKIRSIAISVVLLMTSLASAQSDHSKAYWQKQYNKIAQMFATKDTKAFIATLDPKFVYIDDKGKTHTRAEFIGIEVDPIKKATKVEGTVKVTSIKVSGEMVAVNYDWRYKINQKGPRGMSTDVGQEIGTDTWHKVGSKWLTVKTALKSVHDKMLRA